MKNNITLLFALLLLSSIAKFTLGIKWLAIDRASNIAWRKTDCDRFPRFISMRQSKVCRGNLMMMKFLKQGAQLAKEECKDQLRQRTWDCSSADKAPYFGSDLTSDTKEAGFVYALSTAALTFTISKACLSGKLAGCSCSNKAIFVHADKAPKIRQRDFGGCPDITTKGAKFAKQFTIAELKKKHARSAAVQQRNRIKKHNIKLGTQVVRDLLSVNCRCHGVTGACQMKHCMKRLPTFQEVAKKLVDKYDNAVQIDMRRQRNGIKKNPSIKGILLYADPSPNYCNRNKNTGVDGTSGRECLLNGAGKQSCANLCCGRGFDTQTIEIAERCKCRYIWCCEVKCEICKSTRLQHTCR